MNGSERHHLAWMTH